MKPDILARKFNDAIENYVCLIYHLFPETRFLKNLVL